MPAGHGLRSRTRDLFARPFRKKGYVPLTTYLRTYKIGDYVDVKVNAAIHKGMPHKFYHGRTGKVWNVTKRAIGVEINKQMPAGHGLRSRTRDLFARPFRKKGYVPLTTYLRTYKIGDYVDVKVNAAIHKGMPHKFYHGRTGKVWNVTKRAIGVEINKQVGNRIIKKRIHVRVEHVQPSRCAEEFRLRKKKNDELKAEAKSRGETISTKRQPEGPKPGFMVEGATLETVTPIPYDVVNDLKGGY
ncbi:hypothetical protein M5K25_016203 [Dendrobium thyrsiflorum]|uniref:60S ribosomal protein L21 n=1 Tax=Dendrobium thyrsiflorum TaxID=117978 RepID=A0ABD0UJ14_DENTH